MKPIFPRSRMNKSEQHYAASLEAQKRATMILDYRFEPFGLRLAEKTFYHPDFLVICTDRFQIHEVKGFWRDDARAKIKIAAQLFPWFEFIAVTMDKRGKVMKREQF